jgi:hypothetical protein
MCTYIDWTHNTRNFTVHILIPCVVRRSTVQVLLCCRVEKVGHHLPDRDAELLEQDLDHLLSPAHLKIILLCFNMDIEANLTFSDIYSCYATGGRYLPR